MPDTPVTVHASRHSATAPAAMRTHRHRQASTAAIPPTATHTTPSRPDGTPTNAPGTPAAHRATRSSHHNSGPVNRISSCAPGGHSGHSAAAAVPTTVIGGITAATARLATTDTTLNVPDIPATSGAVTSCAATATLTASAGGFAQPRATKRCDHAGAITTSAAVAETDSANPTSTASSGAAIINMITLADNTGMACLRRCETTASSVMAPITAARSTLADGCTTMTNAASASAASATASLGPRTAAVIRTAPQTMVTFAPDTAVKCVSPAERNSSVVCAVNVEVS